MTQNSIGVLFQIAAKGSVVEATGGTNVDFKAKIIRLMIM